ncbi:co-chaperone YbbN [Trueperella sp. LYQ143]|uniref:co-chaperone YbbN n=1 Tax=Trueperella sp. LYQ143 TaxID=3391059 RepID=UPI0039838340
MDLTGSQFRGAVDFSTLSTQSETQPNSAGQPENTVAGPYITDVTETSLQGILTMSMQVPVLLVFTSAHSENSQQLQGQLELIAQRYAGQFQLGRVNVDTETEVVGAFGITAVPAVCALLQGQPIPLFQGMPDAEQLEQTVENVLTAAAQYGITGVLDGDESAHPPQVEVPPLHKEGLAALERGDIDAAHQAYSQALREDPADQEAQSVLYQVELLQRLRDMNPDNEPNRITEILESAANAPMTDLDIQLCAADIELSHQRPDAACARLIDVVRHTDGEDRDAARQRLIAYFDILGPCDLVMAARKSLANALF